MDELSLTGKKFVVTGGAGFVASHLCDKLLAYEPSKLIVIDNFSLGKERNIKSFKNNPKVEILKQDASDFREMRGIFDKEEIDAVFNLAVIPLPKSLRFPKETVEENVLMTTTACELLRLKCFRTLIHCSSSEAYGTALYVPMDEGHPEKPLTPYAASKIACDHIVTSYYKTFGLDVAIARPFNAYGPRQNEHSYAGVIPLTIERILNGQKPIIHGDGLQTRDYTYVEDTAEAILQMYMSPQTRGHVVNIASGQEISIKRIIEQIIELTDYKGPVEYAEPRPGDVRRHRGDISLARQLIGYKPMTDFYDGLKKTISWYKSEWLESTTAD
jgi:UDP-glucose 4-epimerase